MSWDGLKLFDQREFIYTIDGKWYIFMEEWYEKVPRVTNKIDVLENDRKQIVLRSTISSIYGPYE
jgi:hypothetical protein